MCGIFISLLNNSDIDINDIDFELLKKRGPDSFQTKIISLNNGLYMLLASSVLSLRGGDQAQVTTQPLIDSNNGNILLWNGEIFSSDLVRINEDENDGFKLLNKLGDVNGNEDSLFKIFESIKGPYAFVFYEKSSNTIYFGRDKLGRRSLLISINNDHLKSTNKSTCACILTLSSVKISFNRSNSIKYLNEFEELKANGIYKFNTNEMKLSLYEWKKPSEPNQVKQFKESYMSMIDPIILTLKDNISVFNDKISQIEINSEDFENLVENFYLKLKESVMRRVKSIPTNCKACSHLQSEAIKFLRHSSNSLIKCDHSKVAILFSGGVDSAVLAAIVDQCLPGHESIDLLNVAFEKQNNTSQKPNEKKSKDEDKSCDEPTLLSNYDAQDEFLVPDRISGLESLKELNPNRKWNFVEINVTLDELKKERENLIRHLLYPHQTVLDESIGCALWFASRGKGMLRNVDNTKIPFQSNAEVLLLGMGADEQLAGYARHRTKYEKEGFKALCNELKMEMKRISERNLGRDDRILSDHGKESRLPYLDEDLINFLNELEVIEKCNMKLPRGQGEKYLLRRLASVKFGLNYASSLQKRAIQFGSRVAKIENGKEKASDICDRIVANLNLSSNLTN